MLRVMPVFRILGGLFLGIAVLMTVPFLLDAAAGRRDASFFLSAMVIAVFAGLLMIIISASREGFNLTRRQAFLTTALAWVLTPAIAALPFLGAGLTFVDAYFEAASGLTTTGATVMGGLDETAPGLLLWRSLLQWIGGIGIIVLGIIVMPFLRVGGMQLFQTESSDQSEKIVSKALDLVRWIAAIYLGLTIACAGVYSLLGMSGFDAVNHAFTTISTGGFSTHDASFGHFGSAGLEWAGVVFMAAGALPFVAYIRALRGGRGIVSDIQVRAFLGFLAAVIAALTLTHFLNNGAGFLEALRLSAFNVTSIVTTTGYASDDYQRWGSFAVGAFFVLTFIGGCSGSTSGGVKIYRFQILARLTLAHLSRLVSPSRVIVIRYGARRIEPDVEIAILTFLAAMLFTAAVFTLILSWLGLDLVTAGSAAATCLTNVGPGLGPIVGPAGNFAPLPDSAKAVLAFAMILGRLEFFTLLVFLTPAFWRG